MEGEALKNIIGKYKLVKNENLDEYFSAIGVPYLPRKMMLMSTPIVEISVSDDTWTIKTATLMRTAVNTFKLGVEYEETMPGNTLKSVTTLEGNKLITVSQGTGGTTVTRTYEFLDAGCTLTYFEKKCNKEAKRYYDRIN